MSRSYRGVVFLFKNSRLFKSSNDSSNECVIDKSEEKVERIVSETPSVLKAEANTQHTSEIPAKSDVTSPDAVGKMQALRSKMISASLGEMVTLLMRSPHYKHYSLSDLEWLVIPALLNNQFLVVEAQVKKNPNTTDEDETKDPSAQQRIPVGLALWARVSKDVDEKISKKIDAPIKLRPDEWNSGEINWLVDIVGDPKIFEGLYNKLRDDVFKGEVFKVRASDKDGNAIIKEISKQP